MDAGYHHLYEYGNIEALSEKLLQILEDNTLREKLETGGLEWAEKFNWDKAARKFDDLLKEIVGDKA